MKVAVSAEGVQAPGYRFENGAGKPSPWQAKWIWLAETNQVPAAMFRKEIVLTNAPTGVKAWATADAKYRLFVNGQLVARGPVDMGLDYAGGKTHHWFYDFRDLTPFFTKGTNVITAEVFRQGPDWTDSRGAPGFLFEAEIANTRGEKRTIASDATWRSRAARQFPDLNTFDARLEPTGWRLAGFDDADWQPSSEVNDVWSPLTASEIPPRMEATYPVLRIEGLQQKVITNDATFRVVFDRVLSAYPTLKVKGGSGAEVTIKANNEARTMLRGGEETLEFPRMTEIAPSFTVEVKHVTEPLEIESAGANFTSQPVDYRGSFACSDEKLNRLWSVSRWAVQICLQTHHLDSPNHQEPISDPGDYVIESMVNYYSFAQPWLTRQDVRKFAWLLKDENYHNFHTSYSIAWLQMLMDYYDYTGDESLVKEMAPYVHELMDTYASWRGTNGIISEAPNYMFMDWVTIGGFECHHPPAVIGQGYLTAFYYHAMEMASRVAALMGDEARLEQYGKLRGEIREAFNRELWVADKGLYRDGKPFQTSVKPYQWLPEDKDIETFSPHVNMLAVLYDLAPKERQSNIVVKVLAEKPLNTQPWFMHWVFQAMDHAGLFDRFGTEQMRRWQIVPETQSFHEMWNGGDLSHGWCSSPLVMLSSRVLGVMPATPGFKTISIRPELCDLKWARGKVPTPHGEVRVAWELGDAGFKLDVTVPQGSDAEVALPLLPLAAASVTLDGRESAPLTRLGPGEHHFRAIRRGQ
jgi:hypothetical protein